MPSTLGAETFVVILMSALTSIPGMWTVLNAVVPDSKDSLFLRRLKVYNTAINAFLRVRYAQWKTKGLADDDPKSMKIWEATHRRNADDFYSVGTSLEGVWIKAGQYMSTRADVLPLPYIEKLRPLTDSLPPKPFEEVEQTILEDMGVNSLSQAFASVDRTPLATASIAQVHRAVLLDGTQAVVKVQHRNVADKIRQDLRNLSHIVELVARYEPEWDLRPVLDEWARELPAELDFRKEAANMKEVEDSINEFQASLAKLDELPALWKELGLTKDLLRFSVRLPKVVPDFVKEKVLVLEYVDGFRLSEVNKMKAAGVDLDQISRAITHSYGYQIFTTGIYNADPHAGNFLVAPTDPTRPAHPVDNPYQAVLLDFGLTKHLTSSERLGLSRMLISASEVDYAGLLSSLEEIGLKLNIDEPQASMDVVRFLFRRGESREESMETNKQKREEWEKADEERKRREKERGAPRRKLLDAFPSCLILFGRVLNLLRGVSTGLGAKENYLEGLSPFAKVGLVGDFESSAAEETRGTGAVWDTVSRLREERHILGVQVSVRKAGAEVPSLSAVAGHMGRFDPRPYAKDTLTNVYSATKPVVALAIHLLVAEGKCGYDDPVVRYWPSYAREGTAKSRTTIRDVLEHRAGMQDAATREIALDAFIMRDWDKMMKLMEEAEPDPEPGTETRYHYFSYAWLAGGLVQKVAGKPCMDYIRERIFVPLGYSTPETSHMFIGIPSKVVDTRLASVVWDLHEVRAMFSRAAVEEGEEVADGERNDSGFGVGSIEDLVERTEDSAENGVANGAPAPEAAPGAPATPKKFDLREALRSDPRMQAALLTSNPTLFNHLFLRRAVIPSANGHFSAHGLSAFHAEIAAAWSGKSKIVGLDKARVGKMAWGASGTGLTSVERELADPATGVPPFKYRVTLSQLARIGKEVGQQLVGGGLMRYLFVRPLGDAERAGGESHEVTVGIGHAGFGGSVGLALPSEDASVAIVVNKLDVRGGVTRELLDAVAGELGIGRAAQFGAVLDGAEGGEGAVNAELNPFGRMI
ncbi:hypothetical protein DFJ74DRAFT_756244 [Hyaloraphidium curvatum]|nr:hypothetical protein DFJ74DRAFT_756244 [Hyaloraphidium curvatum]